MLIEQVDIKSDKLFSAADINSFSVKNAKIEARDAKITLEGIHKLTFENIQFIVPGNNFELLASPSEDFKFIKSTPEIGKTDVLQR